MSDFDWVTARANCSISGVFERVKTGVERDTIARRAIDDGRGYEFGASGSAFWVIMQGASVGRHVVRFALDGAMIVVTFDDQPLLTAGATLSSDGECRLTVKGDEMEFWQFRRRALERLFFYES